MRETGGDDEFRDALQAFLVESERLAGQVLEEIAGGFDGGVPSPEFRGASYLQVNSTGVDLADGIVQDKHEDGHLITIHNATDPGLVLHLSDGDELLVEPDPARATVMAGSALTLMTGGGIDPMYHSVVKRGRPVGPTRLAVMYFVNPEPRPGLAPFVVNDTNRGVDLAEYVDSFPTRFGLPRLLED